jgi:predicted MFS family arabinose efflux permease
MSTTTHTHTRTHTHGAALPRERERHPAAALAVLLMAPLLAQADATIANVATPAIGADLRASGAALELVIGGYLVAYAVLLITGARLGQTHGYTRLFLIGASAFGAASLVGGLAPDATVLVVTRVIQGGAAAMMYPQALTGVQLNFSGDERARAIGFFAIALASGAVIGQILSGWRPIFLVNVPICLAVVVAALRYLPADDQHGTNDVDLPGVAALSASVLLVIVPLIVGRSEGRPVWSWVALAASVPAFAVFLATQRAAAASDRDPLVNVAVIARRPVALGLLALLTANGTYYALLFTLAQYFQSGLARSALASGLILVPWLAAFGVAGQVARRLPPRMAVHLPIVGYLLLAIAYEAIAAALFAGRPPDIVLYVLLALGGFGLGTGFATMIGHLTSSVPTRCAPDISGVSTTVLQIGGAVGVAAFGSLYLAEAAGGGAGPARHAFAVTCLVLGATALVAASAAGLSMRCGAAPAD